MSKASTHSLELGRPESSMLIFDICAMIPVLSCVYAEKTSPLLIYVATDPPTGASRADRPQSVMTPRVENKIVWPTLAAITHILIVRNRSRLTLPPHIKWLMRGMDMFWLMFATVAAETGRYWQPSHPDVSKPPLRSPVIAARRPDLARAWGADGLARFPPRRM